MDGMMNKTVTFASLGGALLYLTATAIPASAIECRGTFAYNSAAGSYISNSICEDKLIAKVSGYPHLGKNGVKQNPSVKAEACMFASSDIRISHLCADLGVEDNGSDFE